jgi:hypothetical protein
MHATDNCANMCAQCVTHITHHPQKDVQQIPEVLKVHLSNCANFDHLLDEVVNDE